jgi:uncharacterized protein (TIGR03086 family)
MPTNLEPATKRLDALVRGTPPGALDNPTPCDIGVAALLDHIGTLATAFTAAARKDPSAVTGPPPAPDPSHLDADWRETIPLALSELASAWDDPTAWTGMTRVGGIDMPGEAAGVVALDEVVLHGWDLARATGRPYEIDDESLQPLVGFLNHMAEPDMIAARAGLFGPVVLVAESAPLIDHVLGLSGRDPMWPSRASQSGS